MEFKLSPPWAIYYRKINALFGEDPEIRIVYDEDTPEIKLYVDSVDKADAMAQLLPVEKEFGNVKLKITVIPPNKLEADKISVFEKMFKGNPVISFITGIQDIFATPLHYIVFKNKVVQYHNDDLSDFYGNCSTLYQDIAKEIFGNLENIYFCTDREK